MQCILYDFYFIAYNSDKLHIHSQIYTKMNLLVLEHILFQKKSKNSIAVFHFHISFRGHL